MSLKSQWGKEWKAIVNRRCVFCWIDLAVKGKKRNTVQLEWGAGLNKEFLQILICMSGAKGKVLMIGREGFLWEYFPRK